jgi:hypothetical protein
MTELASAQLDAIGSMRHESESCPHRRLRCALRSTSQDHASLRSWRISVRDLAASRRTFPSQMRPALV